MQQTTMSWQQPSTITQAANALRSDCVLLTSTDTVLGLLTTTTQKGFQALNSIKQRYEKPYIVLIPHLQAVAQLVDTIPADVHRLLQACWPGPLTIIFKVNPQVPTYMQSPDGKIALRVPQHQGLLKLLHQIYPLFSTSANVTGVSVPYTITEVDPSIIKQCAYVIIDEDQQITQTPSTIIDVTQRPYVMVREGAYSIDALRKIVPALEAK